ncbi:MAG: hypothetical protein WC213_00075 [Arenimonas sp.]
MSEHLERLSRYTGGGRVFSIELNDDGTFSIWENCDNYFSEDFTAEELRELAQEIIDVSYRKPKGGAA